MSYSDGCVITDACAKGIPHTTVMENTGDNTNAQITDFVIVLFKAISSLLYEIQEQKDESFAIPLDSSCLPIPIASHLQVKVNKWILKDFKTFAGLQLMCYKISANALQAENF